MPQLRRLEEVFPNTLLIIGVHSAKYTAEGDDRHLRQAILRLGIDHPVVNDREMRVWSAYAVRAWPTLMFIGPDGRVIGKHEGEFEAGTLSGVIEQIIDAASADLQDDRIDWLAPLERPAETLAFPMTIRNSGGRLAIADTGHGRIVVTDSTGKTERVFDDQLVSPHGLAFDGETVIVADAGDHSLRQIDLATGATSMLAGTGEIAHSYSSGGPALQTPLRSPWDVCRDHENIYISMAGSHQLWRQPIGSSEIRRFAGTGHEARKDGPLASAWLAQPTAMDLQDGSLVFCDAETSSIRIASLGDGRIETLVGQDLFDWGDVDGALPSALLQHPSGVAWHPSGRYIFVSDTYNNKIKRIDLEGQIIETVAGNGEPGWTDGAGEVAQFFEPHGLAVVGDSLFVADTNNHRIRRIDLSTSEVSTVELRS